MIQEPQTNYECFINIYGKLLSLDMWKWGLIIFAILFLWHLSLHKREASLSPKKICKVISFVIFVFITTLLCNLSMRNIMAEKSLSIPKNMVDISDFYNNIITYLSIAFAVLSLVAYNSIKVLTEEKARMMVEKEINERVMEVNRRILKKYQAYQKELESYIETTIDENFGKKYGDKIESVSVNLRKIVEKIDNDDEHPNIQNEEIELYSKEKKIAKDSTPKVKEK